MKNFRLVEVGRGKWTGEICARSASDLLRQIRRHLASSVVEVTEDGAILVGGFRSVGRVEPLHDIAKAQLARWVAGVES
jgi:hypothetical protein